MSQTKAKRGKGRRSHHWRDSKRYVPTYKPYPTKFSELAIALGFNSDVKLAIALGPRATRHTVRAWRRGQRNAAQWALDVLQAKKEAAEAAP